MALNLGNYSGQLSIDDYNRALQAGGSSYQLPQQNSYGTANPYATSGTQRTAVQGAPVQQARDTEMTPTWAQDNARSSGGTLVGVDDQKKDGGKLSGILGVVGKIAAFL